MLCPRNLIGKLMKSRLLWGQSFLKRICTERRGSIKLFVLNIHPARYFFNEFPSTIIFFLSWLHTSTYQVEYLNWKTDGILDYSFGPTLFFFF